MNCNSTLLKFTSSSIQLKTHSLTHNNLANISKISKIVSLNNNNIDTLTLSKQALFKTKLRNLDKSSEIPATQGADVVEQAMFINMVGSFINLTLDSSKTEIEDNLKAYSSYISKVDDGTLDKNIPFDDYADSEIKKKYQPDLTNVVDSLVSKTDSSTVTPQENKPVENIESVETIKMQALSQLQNRIKKIVDKSINSITHTFDGISVSSKELSDKIDGLKQNVTALTSSLKKIDLDSTKSESELAESLKGILQNINKTQNTIRNYAYTELKNSAGLDKDYLNKLTYKFENETANNLKRYQYDISLIDSTLNKK